MQDSSWSHAEEPKLFHPDSDGSDLPASFLWMEPPDHTRLRRLVSKAFTARRVEGLREQVDKVAGQLIDNVTDAGEVDWVEQVAYPLPLTMITDMLGVPAEAHDMVRSMSQGISRGLDPDLLLSPQELDNRRTSSKAFKDYFGELVLERRKNPKDDLISDLARVEAEGERLTTDEMLSTLVVLVVAGHETTVSLLGNGLLSLMRSPGQYAALCADPDLARPAVSELRRYDGPAHFTTREATRTVEVGGRTFTAGEGTILLLASGNRDALAYEDPDRLDLARYAHSDAVPRHLGFGVGCHYCIGAPLVRVEMEGAADAGGPGTAPGTAGRPATLPPNLVVRGLQALPVKLSKYPKWPLGLAVADASTSGHCCCQASPALPARPWVESYRARAAAPASRPRPGGPGLRAGKPLLLRRLHLRSAVIEFFDQFTERHGALLAEQQSLAAGAYYLLVAEDGSVLGRFNLYRAANGAAELGYRVAQHAALPRLGDRGRTGTVSAGGATGNHRLRTIRAATSRENIASQRVLAKAGFVPVSLADPADIGGKPGTWYQRDLAADGAPQRPPVTSDQAG